MPFRPNFSTFKTFSSIDDANIWGNDNYGQWAKKYQKNMRAIRDILGSKSNAVVECYCGYDFRHINNCLRGTNLHDYDPQGINYYKDMVTALSIIIAFAPPIPEDIVLYRAVCDEFVYNLKQDSRKDSATLEKGFVSTTLTKETFMVSEEPFTHETNILKLFIPKNTRGIYTPCVAGRTVESEMLLLPNGYFRLIQKPYICEDKKIFDCQVLYH